MPAVCGCGLFSVRYLARQQRKAVNRSAALAQMPHHFLGRRRASVIHGLTEKKDDASKTSRLLLEEADHIISRIEDCRAAVACDGVSESIRDAIGSGSEAPGCPDLAIKSHQHDFVHGIANEGSHQPWEVAVGLKRRRGLAARLHQDHHRNRLFLCSFLGQLLRSTIIEELESIRIQVFDQLPRWKL